MTKEAILDEHLKYAWECDQCSIVIHSSAAEKAMDEYAKQQAIAFHIFTIDNVWQYNATEYTWHQYNWHSEGVSFEVVWNQFIEQQQNK